MSILLRVSIVLLAIQLFLLGDTYFRPIRTTPIPLQDIQSTIKELCREDEVFAWVANDMRGCVNYEELP
jgi:hypothetical protein